MPSIRLRRALAALFLVTFPGCGAAVGAALGAGGPKAEVTGAIGPNALVMGEDERGIALGRVVEDKGDTLLVDWGDRQAPIARDRVSPAVSLDTLKPGDRVAASTGASDLIARPGSVLSVAPGKVRVKWDVDESESDVTDGSAAKLIAPLCKRDRGCKFGTGQAPTGPAAAALPGVRIGSRVAVSHKIKDASYWSAGEVLDLLPAGVLVNVPGTGHLEVEAANVRLPATREEIVPDAELLFGSPPGGLAPGYVIRVEGDQAEMSFSKGSAKGSAMKIGAEIFKAP